MSGDYRDPALQTAFAQGQYAQAPLAVLFIDPDVASAERLARPLRGRYATAIVPSAQAAQTAIHVRMPDLVVTEIDLPDANGLNILSRLRTSPETQHILLIVVTSRTSVNDKIAAFQAGGDDYLVKPVDPEKFETHLMLISRFRKVIRT
jgi:PleD family two-component response regulator